MYIKQYNDNNKGIKTLLRRCKGEIKCDLETAHTIRAIIYQRGLAYYARSYQVNDFVMIKYDVERAMKYLDFHPCYNLYKSDHRYLNIHVQETEYNYRNRLLRMLFRLRYLYNRNFSPSGELMDCRKENRYTKIEERILNQLRIIGKYFGV